MMDLLVRWGDGGFLEMGGGGDPSNEGMILKWGGGGVDTPLQPMTVYFICCHINYVKFISTTRRNS